MKLIIAGSRSLNPTNDQIKEVLDSFGVDIKEVECIVSGGAKGTDTCAIDFAKENNIPVILFLPEYEKFGKRAPPSKKQTDGCIRRLLSFISRW